MDSNETIRPLTEVPVEQTSETLVSSSATAEENNATYVPKQTKEEVIERLKEINEDACNADKQELDLLKQNFYKLHKAEQEENLPNLPKMPTKHTMNSRNCNRNGTI